MLQRGEENEWKRGRKSGREGERVWKDMGRKEKITRLAVCVCLGIYDCM